MTREEIRGLIGGYATGTLTEAERKALFEAALEDQELFDELAREQALKEAIEEPGAKERLLAAVARKAGRPWWRQPWSWAAVAAACVAMITGIVLLRPRGELQQLARVEQPALPQPPAAAATPTPEPSSPTPSPKRPSPPMPESAPKAIAAPPAVEKSRAEPGSPEPPKTEARTPEPPTPESPKPIAPDGKSADELRLVVPPAAEGQLGQAFAGNSAGTVAGTLATPVPAPAAAPAAAPAGGGRGGRGGRGGGGRGGARALAAPMAARPQPFAFDYSITPEGALRVVPAANGFLSVYSNDGNTARSLFFNRPLQAGVPAEIPLPADCVEAMAEFSMREIEPGLPSVTGPLDPSAGTKSDPNPRPESLLIALIPVKR